MFTENVWIKLPPKSCKAKQKKTSAADDRSEPTYCDVCVLQVWCISESMKRGTLLENDGLYLFVKRPGVFNGPHVSARIDKVSAVEYTMTTSLRNDLISNGFGSA